MRKRMQALLGPVAPEFAAMFVVMLVAATAGTVLGDPTAGAVAVGLVFFWAISVVYPWVGTGHINPAVTIGAAVAKAAEWKQVPGIFLAQLMAAYLAGQALQRGLIMKELQGITIPLPVPDDLVQLAMVVVAHALLTGLLVATALQTVKETPKTPRVGGLVVGTWIGIASRWWNGVMNPAIWVGIVAVNGTIPDWKEAILYFVSPLLGGLVAGYLNR